MKATLALVGMVQDTQSVLLDVSSQCQTHVCTKVHTVSCSFGHFLDLKKSLCCVTISAITTTITITYNAHLSLQGWEVVSFYIAVPRDLLSRNS